MKYYGIKSDTISFVETDWDIAKEKMKGLKNLSFKGFKTKEEADAFINNEEISLDLSEPTAFIDGSYNKETGEYSFGGILIIDNKIYKFKKKYPKDDAYSDVNNVAGEIKGAGYIIQHSINNGIKKIHIYYDYLGIEMWYTGVWKATTPIAIEYVKFSQIAKEKINVVFHKVKSHTNNKYNDMADMLAKEALR